MEPVFSWAYVKTIGILSSSVPYGCMRGFWVSKVSASELLDGTLKLRHCTSFFVLFLGWSLPEVGNGSGQRSGLPGRLVPEHWYTTIQIQGIQRRGDGKDCAPFLRRRWVVRWACLAIFFSRLGVG